MLAPLASFDAHIFWVYLSSGDWLLPAWTTVWLTVAAMQIGIILGLLGALGRQSHMPILRVLVGTYLWVFRGTPVLVQLIFWYDATAELTGSFINLPDVIAATIALGINEGAYMTEIVRAGLLSVDPGQHDAARALGMTRAKTMRHIVIPQALRVIIPPTGNEYIGMLKTTSLVFVIGVPDIFGFGSGLYSQSFRYFEVLSVECLWYLLFTSLLTVLQQRLEAHFGYERTNRGRPPGGIAARWLTFRWGGERVTGEHS